MSAISIATILPDFATPRRIRRPSVEKQMLAQLLTRSAAIRDDLDEAARGAGGDSCAANALPTACDELVAMRTALLKMI